MRGARWGFSMVEIIFVIVILGIVASIASNIIVQVYENYIIQRAVYRVNLKSELAMNEIINRLTYRVQGTTISKDHLAFKGGHPTSDDWLPLSEVPAGGIKYTTVEWIGYDNDSFASNATPNWSGVSNYETATIDGFSTPASDLNRTARIVSILSQGRVDLSKDRPAGVIFMQSSNYYDGMSEYSPECMGMVPEVTSSTDCIFPVYADCQVGYV